MILLVVATMAIFVNGYSSRKRYMPGIIISVLVAQINLFVKIGETGISEYMQAIANVSSQSWVVSIAYVFFIWGIGYILGGINIKRSNNSDDLPGKDAEPEGCNLD